MKRYILKRILFYVIAIFIIVTFTFFIIKLSHKNSQPMIMAKPVIYLYPTEETEVFVDISVKSGDIFCTYPEKNNGWLVTAQSDGTLTDRQNISYDYLFWEAKSPFKADFTEGFVIEGAKSQEFLQQKLSILGLNQKEINDFIVYWLPQMVVNKYNLVSFQWENYDAFVPLEISPKPDSLQRVFMALKPLDNPIDVIEQELIPFKRQGFSVIEWGGTLAK